MKLKTVYINPRTVNTLSKPLKHIVVFENQIIFQMGFNPNNPPRNYPKINEYVKCNSKLYLVMNVIHDFEIGRIIYQVEEYKN